MLFCFMTFRFIVFVFVVDVMALLVVQHDTIFIKGCKLTYTLFIYENLRPDLLRDRGGSGGGGVVVEGGRVGCRKKQ